MNTDRYYLDLFKVSRTQVEQVVATALSHGGDYADLYFEHTTSRYSRNMHIRSSLPSERGFLHHNPYGILRTKRLRP